MNGLYIHIVLCMCVVEAREVMKKSSQQKRGFKGGRGGGRGRGGRGGGRGRPQKKQRTD